MSTASPVKDSAIIEIERLGFAWHMEVDYDLAALEGKQRVLQVREAAHYSPNDLVAQYVVMMGETPFPPPVVTLDGQIVDGNTRVKARLKRKEKITPAIVVEADYAGGSDKQRTMLDALAATLNQMGGQRLTPKETREVTSKLIRLGWKTEQIGRAVGAKAGTVTQIKREIEATKKLKQVGMDANGALKGASLRALGVEKVVGLNDAPFRDLAQLAADAGFNSSEIVATAVEVKELGSDEAALARLKELRVENGDRIRERELTGIGKPPVARQLRQHLGFVTKFSGREQELLETDPKVDALHIEALTVSIGVLSEVLRMQKGSA